MTMNQQDLVWVRLPFTSMEQAKVRPAVVVSNNNYNKRYEDIIVCAVTSKISDAPYGIIIGQENLSSGRLPVRSRIKADKIMQIGKGLVIKPFARLDDKAFDLLLETVFTILRRE